ncbi:hypothetical protein AURDEDRAFT_126957 [Auricularia subglabra TFB-10046 SS5]|nr:hypothetical protein AURDEDRAFT_126957 [Auricularia subglabra TFB-10046 SS5]
MALPGVTNVPATTQVSYCELLLSHIVHDTIARVCSLPCQSTDNAFSAFHIAFAGAWTNLLPYARVVLPSLRLACCAQIKITVLSFQVWQQIRHSSVHAICSMVSRAESITIAHGMLDNASELVLCAVRLYVGGLSSSEREVSESRANKGYKLFAKRIREPDSQADCLPSTAAKPTVESMMKTDYFVCCQVTKERPTKNAFITLWNRVLEDKVQVQLYVCMVSKAASMCMRTRGGNRIGFVCEDAVSEALSDVFPQEGDFLATWMSRIDGLANGSPGYRRVGKASIPVPTPSESKNKRVPGPGYTRSASDVDVALPAPAFGIEDREFVYAAGYDDRRMAVPRDGTRLACRAGRGRRPQKDTRPACWTRPTTSALRWQGVDKSVPDPCKGPCGTRLAFDDTPLKETSEILANMFNNLDLGASSPVSQARPIARLPTRRQLHPQSSQAEFRGCTSRLAIPRTLQGDVDNLAAAAAAFVAVDLVDAGVRVDKQLPSSRNTHSGMVASFLAPCALALFNAERERTTRGERRRSKTAGFESVADALLALLLAAQDGSTESSGPIRKLVAYIADLSQTLRQVGDGPTEIELELDENMLNALALHVTSCDEVGAAAWDPRSVVNYIVAVRGTSVSWTLIDERQKMVLSGANPEAIRGMHLNTTEPPYLPRGTSLSSTGNGVSHGLKTNFPADVELWVYVDLALLFEKNT